MFANVQACDFFILIGADRHEEADDLEDDERADNGQGVSDDSGNNLSDEQIRAAVEEAVSPGWVDFRRSPDAGGDGAPPIPWIPKASRESS